jgi:hypothetical protein
MRNPADLRGNFCGNFGNYPDRGGDEKAHQAVVEAFLGLLLGLAVMGLSSCRTAPVITTDASYTPADVGKAVMSAGSSLGRQMTKIGPRMIEGTLFLQSHMA